MNNELVEEKENNENYKTMYCVTLKSYFLRIYRCLLAYHNERMKRIKNEFWNSCDNVNPLILDLLSKDEKEFLNSYRNNINEYTNNLNLNINLLQLNEPPVDLNIEVRVLGDYGTILTKNGNVLNLKKNSIILVKKSDIEPLINKGMVIPK